MSRGKSPGRSTVLSVFGNAKHVVEVDMLGEITRVCEEDYGDATTSQVLNLKKTQSGAINMNHNIVSGSIKIHPDSTQNANASNKSGSTTLR